MVENQVRMKLFIWPFLSHYDKNSIKNTVWKNAVYSITNLGIDMTILINIKHMYGAHVCKSKLF
jgi:hypothetical protein